MSGAGCLFEPSLSAASVILPKLSHFDQGAIGQAIEAAGAGQLEGRRGLPQSLTKHRGERNGQIAGKKSDDWL